MSQLKFVFLFLGIIIFSQNKIEDFPPISKDDFVKSKSAIQENAVAEVLYRYESYRVSPNFEVEKIVFKRIKILKKNLAENYLNIEIPLYKTKSESEKLDFLEAKTINEENGTIGNFIVDEKSIYKNKISKDFSSIKFTLPNVKDGSIIEYMYIIKSPFIRELPKVYFEEELPQKYVEYNLSSPDTVGYTLNLNGTLKESEVVINTKKQWGGEYSFWKYIYKDVKPYTIEKFVKNIDNYRASIRPEINSINDLVRLKYSTSWDQVRRKLLVDDRFGRVLEKEKLVEFILPSEILKEKNKLVRADKILKFLQANFIWDGDYGILVNQGLENSLKEKKGNVAEINLLLTMLMKSAGINANPIILSTTNNGKLNIKIPSVTGMNYVITCVEDNGKIYLYDATSRLTKVNILSPKVYNDFGILIDDEEVKIINLPNTTLSQSILEVNAKIDDNGIVNGSFIDEENKLNAILLKEQFDENKEKLVNQYKDSYPFNIGDFKINFNHNDVKIYFNFSSDVMSDRMSGKIIFNPLLFLYRQNHDFNQTEERKYPIEFFSPYETVKKVTITIPEGYKIENLPKSKKIKTEDDGITYSYVISAEGNKITVETSVKIDSTDFPREYYPAFKQIFDTLTQYEGQLVTIVKK